MLDQKWSFAGMTDLGNPQFGRSYGMTEFRESHVSFFLYLLTNFLTYLTYLVNPK